MPPFNGYLFAMWILRGAALSELSGGAIYFPASFARAFLHGATTLWNRRRSVRLGSLFNYLKFAALNEANLSRMRESMSVEEIGNASGWNLETSSAFRDIKRELMNKISPFDQAKIIEATAKIIDIGKRKDH